MFALKNSHDIFENTKYKNAHNYLYIMALVKSLYFFQNYMIKNVYIIKKNKKEINRMEKNGRKDQKKTDDNS